jgi:hypothetical protein
MIEEQISEGLVVKIGSGGLSVAIIDVEALQAILAKHFPAEGSLESEEAHG